MPNIAFKTAEISSYITKEIMTDTLEEGSLLHHLALITKKHIWHEMIRITTNAYMHTITKNENRFIELGEHIDVMPFKEFVDKWKDEMC